MATATASGGAIGSGTAAAGGAAGTATSAAGGAASTATGAAASGSGSSDGTRYIAPLGATLSAVFLAAFFIL